MRLNIQLLPVAILIAGFAALTLKPNGSTPSQIESRFHDQGDPQKKNPQVQKSLNQGLEWLIKAQSNDGGWGAGSHSRQDIRDPHAVVTDPATTAFVGLALIRSGNTLETGPYHHQLGRALDYLLKAVEDAPGNSTNITALTGTQPQTKLGRNIDVSMASQFFSRVRSLLANDPDLLAQVDAANAICLEKIAKSQNTDGSQSGGTWAGVLQSAMSSTALEEAETSSMGSQSQTIDEVVIIDKARSSREFHRKNVSADRVETSSSAGIQLYTLSSTTRATAKQARKAQKALEKARKSGAFGAAEDKEIEVTAENLKTAGYNEEEAREMALDYQANVQARSKLQDEQVLAGFGNNGGEEFISYMMTSESLVVTGGEDWEKWNARMQNMLPNIQNGDGSWSGHHCITSPVFCTAAVVLTLTTEDDQSLLEFAENED